MVGNDIIDDMTQALALEAKCALNYVMTATWPSMVDGSDQAAMDLFGALWKHEEPFLGRLSELVSDVGGSPVLHGTYRFAPSRLNFARAAHLLGVVPPLIRDEIKVLESLSGAIAVDSPFGRVLAELITVKRSGADQLEAMNQANVEARAKAATSGKAAAPASTGGAKSDDPMAFRDADMPLDERMTVVEKQALDMKLWAAMAQTDCTACGYDCEGYAKAIADGTEGDLTKCVPGEDETANVLKKLMSK